MTDAADLDEASFIAVAEGPIPYIKELLHKCQEAEIPAIAGKPPGDCGPGCGTRTHLLVQEADIPRVARLMQSGWLDMVAREGTLESAHLISAASSTGDSDSDELPCPACGTVAPLVEGECSECGLFLGE